MKYIRKTVIKFKSLKLRTKLIISYIALISFPLIVIGFGFYNTSSRILSENARENMYEIVKKNTQIIDIKLSAVQENATMMVIDPDLYKYFENINSDRDDELLKMNYDITRLISKYFSAYEDVFSAHIVTRRFTYGSTSRMFIPEGVFFNTSLYTEAVNLRGKTQWVRTYDFTDMFNQKNLKNTNFDYRYMFSAVKLLNISMVESNNFYDTNGGSTIIKSLKADIERPVLILNFQESMLRKLFINSIPITGAVYYIIDSQGNIISHPYTNMLGEKEDPEWLSEAVKNETGTSFVNIGGEKSLVCYDTLETNGWICAIVVPVDKMLSTLSNIRFYTVYLTLGLTALAMIIAFIISGWIANPIKKLLKGIKSLGEGKFPQKIAVAVNDEIGVLVDNFNEMNEKIQKLIEENYEVKIREKEAQIMALNLQINPHFMSNTLNVINWMAIENNQPEISKMILSLSTMMQYTMENTSELVTFKDDLEWLKSYIFIMSNRYENIFDVIYEFDDRLYNTLVPKLFLQPIVENSIIHGFETTESGGRIKVSGIIIDEKRCFIVEDNGKGMSLENIQKVIKSEGGSIGVKNIDSKIKLLYGNKYGLHIESKEGIGTRIIIMIPFNV